MLKGEGKKERRNTEDEKESGGGHTEENGRAWEGR